MLEYQEQAAIDVTSFKYEKGVLVLYSGDEVVLAELIEETELVEDFLSELEEEGLIKIEEE